MARQTQKDDGMTESKLQTKEMGTILYFIDAMRLRSHWYIWTGETWRLMTVEEQLEASK